MIFGEQKMEEATMELREDRIALREREVELERRRLNNVIPSVAELLLFSAAVAGVILLVFVLA